MAEKKITVIIVSRGLETMLRYCIEHVYRNFNELGDYADYHIVIVDNASSFPYGAFRFEGNCLTSIRLDQDTSFSEACNIAVKSSPSIDYLFLNNDVLLAEKTIASMLDVFDRNPQMGICGTRLLFPDGTLQHAGVVFGLGERGPYHRDRGLPGHLVPQLGQYYQAVTGACMLVRHQVWDQIDGFDKCYDFGLEDIDFCLRARQKGWKVYCVQKTESLHFEAMTTGRIERDVHSRKIFMEKWRGGYCIDG